MDQQPPLPHPICSISLEWKILTAWKIPKVQLLYLDTLFQLAHITDHVGCRKAFSIALNILPKATPRRMNLFSIEVVAVVLDLSDQISISTAKYRELRISMSPDSA